MKLEKRAPAAPGSTGAKTEFLSGFLHKEGLPVTGVVVNGKYVGDLYVKGSKVCQAPVAGGASRLAQVAGMPGMPTVLRWASAARLPWGIIPELKAKPAPIGKG